MEGFKHTLEDKPDFSSLNTLMSRFRSMPYEQFKQELDEWFLASLRKNGISEGEPLVTALKDFIGLIENKMR